MFPIPPLSVLTSNFANELITWQKQHGRHDLPWQNTRDPYAIWLSEIMLQQTQVSTVIPYYKRFLQRFPDIKSLGEGDLDEVLTLWSGLGYYSRARNLHRVAQILIQEYGGNFPEDFSAIQKLPGIGRSTAAAICAFAYGQRQAILDGNVKRVLARCFGIEGYPGERKAASRLWEQAEKLLPEKNVEAYTQGLMDLGARICLRNRPKCLLCPMQNRCVALKQQRIEELPTRKPVKALPQKDTVMLILSHENRILLEKRAAIGIWGGLWSFPELNTDQDIYDFCSRHLGTQIDSVEAMSPITHSFTHFKLNIFPTRLFVTSVPQVCAEPGQNWFTVSDALNAAIPTPVKNILRSLA